MSIDDVDSDLAKALCFLKDNSSSLNSSFKNVHCFQSCSSTQRVALDLPESEAPDGTLVWTRSQTAGRGRQGRTWLNSNDALLFSWICQPQISLAKLPRLTLFAGTALLCALRKLGVDALLKWPNDVVIKTELSGEKAPLGKFRKAAGILVDVATSGKTLERAVVGVGLNAGSSENVLPEIAIGLADLTTTLTRSEVIASVLMELDFWLANPSDNARFKQALDFHRAHSLTLGAEVSVPEENFTGRALDLAEDGSLLVEDAAQKVHRVIAGDVWPLSGDKRYAVQTEFS